MLETKLYRGMSKARSTSRPNKCPIQFKELCAHRTGEGCEIASLATDAGTCRIASAARDGSIQVWTFNAEESLISLFSVRLDRTTPICVAFKDNTTKDIFVVGIYDGER